MMENDRASGAVILFVTQAPEGRDEFLSRKREKLGHYFTSRISASAGSGRGSPCFRRLSQ